MDVFCVCVCGCHHLVPRSESINLHFPLEKKKSSYTFRLAAGGTAAEYGWSHPCSILQLQHNHFPTPACFTKPYSFFHWWWTCLLSSKTASHFRFWLLSYVHQLRVVFIYFFFFMGEKFKLDHTEKCDTTMTAGPLDGLDSARVAYRSLQSGRGSLVHVCEALGWFGHHAHTSYVIK